MNFKLIIAIVDDERTDPVRKAARDAGATGITIIGNARGEGLEPAKSFFGLTLDAKRDVLLFLVDAHLSRHILETISRTANFDSNSSTGIAIQIDVEDAVGTCDQMSKLSELVRSKL